jgi:hypothetical protein
MEEFWREAQNSDVAFDSAPDFLAAPAGERTVKKLGRGGV